jgi:penicillin-insensitive murein endopeptidase
MQDRPPFAHRLLFSGLALSALLVAPVAVAGPAPPKAPLPQGHPALRPVKLEATGHRLSPGKSLGSPTDGHLVGGAHLNEAPHIRIVPIYAAGDARWGLEPLVGMIDHAARTVRKQFDGAVLSVGHLSKPGGGEIDRHASHESGRDADIGFYVKNQQGKAIYADHFVPFRADGTAASWPGAQFDDARNWALVGAIASDVHAHVTHIFVATPLRSRLLAYAEKIGAPPAVRTRAAELMAQPKGALPHDDHFHVRIGCPVGMEQCVEQPLPRKHPHGALARAHSGSQHEKPHASAQAPGHGAQAANPSTKAAASHVAPQPPPSEAGGGDEEPGKSEPSMPSLSPLVPGLDAAVIPVPLALPKAVHPGAPPRIDSALIDDPDGVLEAP